MAAILVLMIMVSRCTYKKEPSGYPQDFRFRLDRTEFNYDSQSQRYNYYDKSITVALTDDELKAIYEYARDIKYLNFPKEFKCDIDDGMTPCFTDRLEIGYDNKYKQTLNDDCCAKIEKDLPEQFNHLVRKITDILNSKEQIKKLPKYDMIFM